jgi:hypothetical protein
MRLGYKNPNWKDNDITLSGLHIWINRNKPKPQSGLCEVCNQESLYDAANITGIYNRDFENWRYACRSCHMKLDYDRGIRQPSGVAIAPLAGINHPMYGRRGEESIGWKGNNATPKSIRDWVRKYMPKSELCETCKNFPIYQLVNITGIGNHDFINWRWMCRSCKTKIDSLMRQRRVIERNNQCPRCQSLHTTIHTHRPDGRLGLRCIDCNRYFIVQKIVVPILQHQGYSRQRRLLAQIAELSSGGC